MFGHIFTFVDTPEPGISLLTGAYLSVFFWMLVMNYFFEGLKIQSLLYVLAQPMLIFSELSEDDTYRGMGLGFFIALSITAMTLVLFFAESANVPI